MQRMTDNIKSASQSGASEEALEQSYLLSMQTSTLERDLTEVRNSLHQDLPQACKDPTPWQKAILEVRWVMLEGLH